VLDPVDGMVAASKHLPQVGFRIGTLQFRRIDQTGDCRCASSSIGPRKKSNLFVSVPLTFFAGIAYCETRRIKDYGT
jgi:hypothetical protein